MDSAATPPMRGSERGTAMAGVGHASVKKHSKEFKEKMEQVLLEDEKQHVIHHLTRYSQNRYTYNLLHTVHVRMRY